MPTVNRKKWVLRNPLEYFLTAQTTGFSTKNAGISRWDRCTVECAQGMTQCQCHARTSHLDQEHVRPKSANKRVAQAADFRPF